MHANACALRVDRRLHVPLESTRAPNGACKAPQFRRLEDITAPHKVVILQTAQETHSKHGHHIAAPGKRGNKALGSPLQSARKRFLQRRKKCQISGWDIGN